MKPPESNSAKDSATIVRFSNVVAVVKEDEEGNEKSAAIPLNAPAIRRTLAEHTDDWPRRVGSALFVRDGDRGPLWLPKTSDLFGWIQSVYGNGDASAVQWSDRSAGLVTKSEFSAYLKQSATRYESVESAPHFPEIQGHFYIHPLIPSRGTSGKLDQLLNWFAPATEEDAQLIVGYLLTLFWGGPYGQRPAFLFTGVDDDKEMGRGIGKTTLVRMSAKLCGGTIDIRHTDKWDEVLKRLLSNTVCSTQRVILIDNVKTHRFSWADVEALITSENINGRKLHVGDGRRPNTFIITITLNGASLSKDLAQRCIIIKLKRPIYSGNWESDLAGFIDANRWQIIGDILSRLKSSVQKIAAFTRWGTWERDILGRLPNPEILQNLIRERREAVDDDEEEADLIRAEIVKELRERGHGDPDDAGVRIPSATMAEIVGRALSEKLSTTAAGTKLKAIGGTITELSKTKYCGNKVWMWRGCNHKGNTEELAERPFGQR